VEIIPTKKSFRQYMIFWAGQTFSLLGSMVVQFVILWYLTITTRSPMVLALANFFYYLPMILLMPIAGVFSDKHSRKKIIMIADSMQSLATVFLIILLIMGLANIWIIFLFIGIRSMFQAFHQPTVNAVVPTMVPKEKLSRVNGLSFLFGGVVQMIGPILAGILLFFITVAQALWIDVITFIMAFIPLIFITIPLVRSKQERVESDSSFIEEFTDGFKTLKSIPGFIILMIMAMLLNFLIQPLSTLMSYFAAVIHDASPFEYALMSAGFQGGIIGGAILTTLKKEWKNKIRVTFSVLVVVMVAYSMFALAPYRDFLYMIVVTFIMGFMLPIVNTLFQTIQQLVIPHEKLGRVSSIDITLSMVITPVGAILAGPLGELLGVANLFFMCGVLGVVVLVIIYFFTGIRHVNYDALAEESPQQSKEESVLPEIIE
jgi:DHA3 family macrolide efflux protein-like MFS transporter